ncbi:MAG: hypothetical protein WDW36_001071 [Sanguina aurantia]
MSTDLQNRNATVLVQEVPRRSAGQYSAGSVGVDPAASSSSAFGTSSSVAKDIITPLAPISSFGSSGESVAVANASSSVPGQASGTRTVVGGLSTAGRKSVATVTGLVVAPNLNNVTVSRRTGAESQNGALAQGRSPHVSLTPATPPFLHAVAPSPGTNSALFVQSTSLAALSPGNRTLQGQVDQAELRLRQLADQQGVRFNQTAVYQGILLALGQSPAVNANQVLDLISQDGDLADLILSGGILNVGLRAAGQNGTTAGVTQTHPAPGVHVSTTSGTAVDAPSYASSDSSKRSSLGGDGKVDGLTVPQVSAVAGNATFSNASRVSVPNAAGSTHDAGSAAAGVLGSAPTGSVGTDPTLLNRCAEGLDA